jgi:hypothetical protein
MWNLFRNLSKKLLCASHFLRLKEYAGGGAVRKRRKKRKEEEKERTKLALLF